jgi:hypothetical protein
MSKMATRSKVQKRICLAYVILMGPANYCVKHKTVSILIFNVHLLNIPCLHAALSIAFYFDISL